MPKGRTSREPGDYASKEQRLRILHRDDWSCQTCGRQLQNEDKGADDYAHAGHVVGVWQGGATTDDNLIAQCLRCNVSDGAKVGGRRKDQAHKQANARVLELEAEVARLRGEKSLRSKSEENFDSTRDEPRHFETQCLTHSPGVCEVLSSSGKQDLANTPGSEDPIWDVPWLDDLRQVPDEGTWPRLMSPPHPLAIGSYGDAFEAYVQDLGVFGEKHELRWWQKLAARRLLEHDLLGNLVWPQAIMTLARQVGKSWLLVDFAMWRIGSGHFDGVQTVVSFGNMQATVERIQQPARTWAHRADEWDARESNGQKHVRNERDGSMWSVRSINAVYGASTDLALGDEAWALPESVISEGVEPTLVERDNSQLILTSTAHRMAKPLMRGRRRELMGDIVTGNDQPAGLLLEWSAGPDDPIDDPVTWRRASPHWSPRRETLIRRAWDRVSSGVTVDPSEPDPIESFKAQWLNIWPDPTEEAPKAEPGEPLLEAHVWDSLQTDPPDLSTGDLVFAVEDYFGRGSAAAIALRLPDDRMFVDGLLFATSFDAICWVRDYLRLFDRGGAVIAVGASLAKDAAVQSLPANITPMTTADTPAALSRFRNLASTGALCHDGCEDLGSQLAECRVSEAGHGTAARVVSKTRTDLLRATAWAVLTHQRLAVGGVNVW